MAKPRSFSDVVIGGNLSIEVLGVERFSTELLGRLLVEEFAELKVVKFISTLCGLDLIFCKVVDAREGCFAGLSDCLTGVGFSNFGGGSKDRRGLDDERALAVIFGESSCSPLCSVSFPLFRLGDGDLDEEIHDLRANVANDSDTVFVLSRGALEIEGTGGISLELVWRDSGLCLSGDPFTRCIQDFGRATKDFRLPTRSSLGRSSFDMLWLSLPSFSDFVLWFFSGDGSGESAETSWCRCFSLYPGLSRAGIELKLADLGSPSACWVVGCL
jgi:hypothetical protein